MLKSASKFRKVSKTQYLIVLVLLSANAERVSASHMRNFNLSFPKAITQFLGNELYTNSLSADSAIIFYLK